MLACALACAFAPSCKTAPPPLGEAVLVVDTDAPVPALVGRLRVDFYTDAGEWFESRDVAALDPSAWPVSFSVYTPDEAKAHAVIVRLRAYAEGKTRDYRGERFAARGDVAVEPVDKRLVVSGADLTPSSEPQPLLTIDRLVSVLLEPGQVGSVRTVLRGACFGTMADLGAGSTCVDTENVRIPLAHAALDPDTTISHDTLAGTFGKPQPCSGAPGPDEVCVPGGAFVFGNAFEYGLGDVSGAPERVALMSAFYMDRHELTVARWRAAYQADRAAFGTGHVILNNGPIANDSTSDTDDAECSGSEMPLGREQFAMSCVTWEAARKLCQRAGGDLPTEAQWELAAQSAGRGAKTRYPWGDEPPMCGRAVYQRLATVVPKTCDGGATGPLPVGAAEHPDGDITALGIVGLGGGVSEIVRDAFFGYDSSCWSASSLVDPTCPPEAGKERIYRGGSWTSGPADLKAASRRDLGSVTMFAPTLGFRCVRAASGGG